MADAVIYFVIGTSGIVRIDQFIYSGGIVLVCDIGFFCLDYYITEIFVERNIIHFASFKVNYKICFLTL